MDRRGFVERSGKAAVAAGIFGIGPIWTEVASAGPTPAQLRALARQIHGSVVTPSSPGYNRARIVQDTYFNSAHPRAIVYCESTTDVQKTIAWARKNGVRIVGRSGGHSYGGYSTTSSGVVVDVSRMNFVQPHGGGTALIGAGSQLIDIYAKLDKRHLMIPGGSCPTVGIAGLALGGGHGWSGRKYGLTSDNIKQLTIVTADGKARVCNAHQNSDLFWACRGGGGGNLRGRHEFHLQDASREQRLHLLRQLALVGRGARLQGLASLGAARAAEPRPLRPRHVDRITAGAQRVGAILRLGERPPLADPAAHERRQRAHLDHSAHVDGRRPQLRLVQLGRPVPRHATRHLQGQVRLRPEAVQPGRDQGGDSRDRELATRGGRVRADPRLVRGRHQQGAGRRDRVRAPEHALLDAVLRRARGPAPTSPR